MNIKSDIKFFTYKDGGDEKIYFNDLSIKLKDICPELDINSKERHIQAFFINVEFDENIFLVCSNELKDTDKEKQFLQIEPTETVKELKNRLIKYFPFDTDQLVLYQI